MRAIILPGMTPKDVERSLYQSGETELADLWQELLDELDDAKESVSIAEAEADENRSLADAKDDDLTKLQSDMREALDELRALADECPLVKLRQKILDRIEKAEGLL